MNEGAKTQAGGSEPGKKRKSLAERAAVAKAREQKAAETLRQRRVKVQKFQAQERSQKRKDDTRRKVIAGALALRHCELDGGWAKTLRGLLDEYVVTDPERLMFELAPLAADDPRRLRAKAY